MLFEDIVRSYRVAEVFQAIYGMTDAAVAIRGTAARIRGPWGVHAPPGYDGGGPEERGQERMEESTGFLEGK